MAEDLSEDTSELAYFNTFGPIIRFNARKTN